MLRNYKIFQDFYNVFCICQDKDLLLANEKTEQEWRKTNFCTVYLIHQVLAFQRLLPKKLCQRGGAAM